VTTFRAPVAGGELVGTVSGRGPTVLLLHGGPGLSDYLAPLVDELADGYTVATYQQRGLGPSTEEGPVTVPAHVGDVLAVLDHLSWERPIVAGHSWGGHLLLHLLAAHPERLAAALVLDPLGAIGDGGLAEFGATLTSRVAEADRPRVEELAAREAADGALSAEDELEQLSLLWPAYFADPASAPPMPQLRISARHAETWPSILAGLTGLGALLSGAGVPTTFVHGADSPMPVTASTDTAALMTAAEVDVLEGAGHYLWLEAPGAVRRSLDALAQRVL